MGCGTPPAASIDLPKQEVVESAPQLNQPNMKEEPLNIPDQAPQILTSTFPPAVNPQITDSVSPKLKPQPLKNQSQYAPVNSEIDVEMVKTLKPIEKPVQVEKKRKVAKPILKAKEIDLIQLKLTGIEQAEKELDKDLKLKALKRCGSDVGRDDKQSIDLVLIE